MNMSALHNTLTQLSESEIKYRNGYVYDLWNEMPEEMINNRLVRRLSFLESYQNPIAAQESLSENMSFHKILSVKRNSRFNPVPEHVHSHIELNYVYSGVCPQTVNGEDIVLQTNQVLLIDTDCPHSIAALSEEDIMISVMIQKDFLRNHLFSQLSQDSILSKFFVNAINERTNHDRHLLFHAEHDRRIPIFFQELFSECYDPSINSNDILMHLFYLIMAELINVYENDLCHADDFDSKTPIASIIRYIESNYLSCTQESVAEFFHISPNYVSTLLKKHLGMSYISLIQDLKIKNAAHLLLNTKQSVTEIANLVGYENISFFYKKFKEKYGYSPKEYRE